MNREIVDYKIVEGDIIRIQQEVKKSISAWRRPIGWVSHVSITHKSHYTQAMVKYAPLPDDSKSLYSESHLKNLESMPRLDLDMYKGEYPPILSSAFEAVSPLSWTDDND